VISGGRTYDVYTCERGKGQTRTLILRYGNEGPAYHSGGLFDCVELTQLDMTALVNGLELTPFEATKLTCKALEYVKRAELASFRDYAQYTLSANLGNGNAFSKLLED
jgi:hypothetical protein